MPRALANPTHLIINRFGHTVGNILERASGACTIKHTGHAETTLPSLGQAKSFLSIRGEFDVVEFDPTLN